MTVQASSRCGTPEELKALIDEAHRLGMVVLMDIVHRCLQPSGADWGASTTVSQDQRGNSVCDMCSALLCCAGLLTMLES